MRTNNSWIDLSVPLETGMVCWPGDPPVRVERIEDLEKGDETTFSRAELGLHAGTHVDAPAHFLCHGATVEKMPSEVMAGQGRVIGIRDPKEITAEELAENDIQTGERLLLQTANSRRRREKVFAEDFVYLTTPAAEFLANRKVAMVGIDALSVGGYRQNETAVHRVLLQAGVWIVENLDLSSVHPGEYELLCLPLKITGAEAAPARVLVRPWTTVG